MILKKLYHDFTFVKAIQPKNLILLPLLIIFFLHHLNSTGIQGLKDIRIQRFKGSA